MDGDDPAPIEVELISHEPRPQRGGARRRDEVDTRGDDADPDAPTRPAGRADRRDRDRLVVVAAVAAVLALALGWMLGRVTTDGSDPVADDAAPGRTSTTIEEPPATLPIVGEAIDGADFEEPAVEEPATDETSGPRPSTTDVAPPTTVPIAVDPRLVDVPVRLVGVELGGVLVEADLAAGTLTEYRGAERFSSDGNPLVVGDDWVVGSWYGGSRVVMADGSTRPIDLGDAWQVLNVPDTDSFWRVPAFGPDTDTFELELVDLAGEPVGPTLELPPSTWPSLVDPRTGGVVVGGVSRNFVIHPGGVEYLGIGAIVGIDDRTVVTYDCDESFVCSLYVTDRRTDVATPVPIDPGLDESFQWMAISGWGYGSASSLSPDGRWVGVVGSSWRSNVAGIVELATGRFVPLAGDSYPVTIGWSPDSRFAFVLDAQVPTVHDTVTGETFPVFADRTQWVLLGLRPPVEADPAANGSTLLSVAPEEPIEG